MTLGNELIKEELEVNFFEPALGLIITNLEFLEDELNQESKNVKFISKFIDNLNELDDYDDFDNLVKKFEIIENEIIDVIKQTRDADKYMLLDNFFTAKTLLNEMISQGSFMDKALSFEEQENISEIELIKEMKKFVISQANIWYQNLDNKDQNDFNISNEFAKVLNILIKEKDFVDFKEANDMLVQLFVLDNKITLNNFAYIEEIFAKLIKTKALITLIDFWEQGETD
ncbi:hypothetical protein ESOMN_v1c03930 [Williamsoniiplasma somnilux]|uniref:Uncharacterized protein n=1 Tax=Williamsoniiplasma somnilux TaxID=215578 RepID=A0A2K8NY68_9MOLU|nr:hypothetical protein [Williamsoniiplasma somnilux]ATZ18775.1 hypothetical protein ESOMN_v1c03930 [Williamsoniiplasma somnilux]